MYGVLLSDTAKKTNVSRGHVEVRALPSKATKAEPAAGSSGNYGSCNNGYDTSYMNAGYNNYSSSAEWD